jgi:polyisoprenoid-binding protein YceI
MEEAAMNRRKRLWIVAVASCLFSVTVAGHAALSSPTGTQVTFRAAGPAGLSIEGTTPDLKAAEDGGNLVIVVSLANLTTGIGLRDQHMKNRYLEVARYPESTLTIARSALKLPSGGERVEADAPGTLQLHGQTRPVSVHYQATRDGDAFAAAGRFRVDMTEFGVNVPSYLGVTVKPDVDVFATFHIAGN